MQLVQKQTQALRFFLIIKIKMSLLSSEATSANAITASENVGKI